MTATHYSIIIACVLLAAFLILKEAQRKNKSRLLWRIVASLLAVISLALLAVPVYFTADENNTTNEAMLLTDGYNKDSVDVFINQNKNAVVYTKDKYAQQGDAYSKLHVFGYGLLKDEWQTLPASNIIFHPPDIGNGITAISYNKQLNSGDVLNVQGSFNNTSAKKIKLVLYGFGVGLDSVVINENKTQTFTLSNVPKFVGRVVYEIKAIADKDTIEHEPIPFEVVVSKPLKVLLLAAYPDFENRFLQNWLSENKYVIASRTTISKNKYSYFYNDTAQFQLTQITPNILQQFDALVADAAELSSLSKQELFTIKNQVNDKGLGLIIKADSTSKPSVFYDGNCAVVPFANHNKQVLSINLAGNDTASALPIENAYFLKTSSNAKPLISDAKSNVLACNTRYGNGSIVFSSFKNSYYWMLSGDKKSYQLLWSLLIGNAAKKQLVNEQWNVQPSVPVVNMPVTITAATVREKPLQATVNNSAVAFAAQPFLPFEWTGTFWPSKQGWQTITSPGGDYHFYVFDKNDYRNITAQQKIQDTYAYATLKKSLPEKERTDDKTHKKTVPLIYFFVVFICCCIFLWIEKKLS